VVLDPFLDPFLHVHFIMIFATLGLMCLVAVLASRRLGLAPLWAIDDLLLVWAVGYLPFVDQYRGRELLLAAYFAGFVHCWVFRSR
jgi:hypothetical protein